MPTKKKTSRSRGKRKKRRAYVDLRIGQARFTAPRWRVRRAVRTVRGAVKATARHRGTGCITLVVVAYLHLLPRR